MTFLQKSRSFRKMHTSNQLVQVCHVGLMVLVVMEVQLLSRNYRSNPLINGVLQLGQSMSAALMLLAMKKNFLKSNH